MSQPRLTAAGRDVPMPRMTRADRATNRGEFTRRFERLCAAAGSGAQVLAAQGALAVLWHHDEMTSSGYLAKTPTQTAELLGVDARTWRGLAQLLEETGLLIRHQLGYRVPDPVALEGTRTAAGVPGGFLRTYRPAYAEHVTQVRAAGRASGHQGFYVLSALGAYELLRVTRVNWRTGVTRWATAAAARLLSLTRRVWAGYLRLLECASVVARAGGLVRVLGWHILSWGPSWRLDRRPLRGTQMQDRLTSRAGQEQEVLTLSTAKSRLGGESIPPTPAADATPAAGREPQTRRRDHPLLKELLQALAQRVPEAAHARWRPRLRQELSYALTVAGGDVAGLAHELTQRELKTARNLPGALAWRCGQAVERLTQKAASQEARQRTNEARADVRERDALSGAQAASQSVFGIRAAKAAPQEYSQLLDLVAERHSWPRPGSPGWRKAHQAMGAAETRELVRAHLPEFSTLEPSGGSGSHSRELDPERLRAAVAAALRDASPRAQDDASA